MGAAAPLRDPGLRAQPVLRRRPPGHGADPGPRGPAAHPLPGGGRLRRLPPRLRRSLLEVRPGGGGVRAHQPPGRAHAVGAGGTPGRLRPGGGGGLGAADTVAGGGAGAADRAGARPPPYPAAVGRAGGPGRVDAGAGPPPPPAPPAPRLSPALPPPARPGRGGRPRLRRRPGRAGLSPPGRLPPSRPRLGGSRRLARVPAPPPPHGLRDPAAGSLGRRPHRRPEPRAPLPGRAPPGPDRPGGRPGRGGPGAPGPAPAGAGRGAGRIRRPADPLLHPGSLSHPAAGLSRGGGALLHPAGGGGRGPHRPRCGLDPGPAPGPGASGGGRGPHRRLGPASPRPARADGEPAREHLPRGSGPERPRLAAPPRRPLHPGRRLPQRPGLPPARGRGTAGRGRGGPGAAHHGVVRGDGAPPVPRTSSRPWTGASAFTWPGDGCWRGSPSPGRRAASVS